MTMQPPDDPMLLSKHLYTSPEVVALEREKLWPKTWLMVCREQEVEKVGDFVVFDIARESIVVVRSSPTQLNAYYNVCQHRGRKLKDDCGNTGNVLYCRFHGWRWNLDGTINSITNREDFDPSPDFDKRVALKSVRLDTWAGWVWVSMDPAIEPLRDYLGVVPEMLAPFELENTRITWHKTLVFPCNWKTIVNAFNEAYHVQATHSQTARYGYPKSASAAYGDHSHFFYPPPKGDAPAAPVQKFANLREQIRGREYEREKTLHALISPYALRAADKLVAEGGSDTDTPADIMKTYRRLHREEMEAAGAKWPDKLTDAHIAKAGVDWHMFPNQMVLPCIDGAQWYRARPNGDDPNSCIYDIWWLERYAPGAEPPVKHEFFPTPESFTGQNFFLEQDFSNLMAVQQGLHSRGFPGLIANPVQEATVSTFHRGIERYLYGRGR
jgi:phenylpropionate dioxygenase-like ring-hydroxylating dioxygenase large terminal subunit